MAVKVSGIQKLTLIDYPGKVAATLFLSGCNFRCPFCHNSALVTGENEPKPLHNQEVMSFLKSRQGMLDGICVSGGEPLLQEGIEDFIAEIKRLGFSVKLDTNGQLFEKLKFLIENEMVDYVAMDIKNSLENYGKAIGIDKFYTSQIEKSADFLISGGIPYEFRTTVVKEFHKKEDFYSIGERFRGAEKYFLQTFVDSGEIITKGLTAYSKEEMQEFRDILAGFIPEVSLREL